jgi:metal-responsive CopG/Arc/MetJ family transcriptional regulator
MPPDDDEPRVPVNFRLTPSLLRELDALAAADNRTRSQMIRVLVIEGIHRRGGERCTQPREGT